jgi:hypothetical protein
MSDTPPDLLTRFYGNTLFATEVLAERKIAFVHTSKLNDPFDPYFFFETEFREDYQKLLQYIRTNHPKDFQWFINHVPKANWLRAVDELRKSLRAARERMFVLSMCSEQESIHPKNNLYMWGHYGNGHRGIAIEFDTAELSTAVLEENRRANAPPFTPDQLWMKILYQDHIAPLTAELFYNFYKATPYKDENGEEQYQRTELDDYYLRLGQIKSSVWSREHEWRLSWNSIDGGDVYKCPIGPSAIRNVYLGQNLDKKVSAEIIPHIRNNFPRATIFQAEKKFGEMGLDYVVV